jgi:uncharacterized protein
VPAYAEIFSIAALTEQDKNIIIRGLMSAPAVIDSLEFARSAQASAGELSIVGLERLHDVLADTEGTLIYSLRGGKDERQRPYLALKIDGELHLQCQRCLEAFSYPLRLQTTLLLVPRGEELDELMDDPTAPDAVEASAELDVAELIEDEVLLSLPLSPRHPEGICASRARRDENHADTPSAFSRLATLKRAGDKT